jgi:hypothetical protein
MYLLAEKLVDVEENQKTSYSFLVARCSLKLDVLA